MESDRAELVPGPDILSIEALNLYMDLLNGARVREGAPGAQELRDRGLAVPVLQVPGRNADGSLSTDDAPTAAGEPTPAGEAELVGVPARHAERLIRVHVVEQLGDVIRELQELPGIFSGIQADAPARDAGKTELVDGSELLHGADLEAALDQMLSSATEEVWVLRSGFRRDVISEAVDRHAIPALKRGVRVHALYGARARNAGGIADWVRDIIEAGAEARSTQADFVHCVVVDWRVAVIAAGQGGQFDETQRAWLVHAPSTLQGSRHWIEVTWAHAKPWLMPRQVAETVTTPLQRKILRGLLAGESQEDAAHAAQVNPTYASRKLNELRDDLGFKNLPQLIAWWVQSEESLLPD